MPSTAHATATDVTVTVGPAIYIELEGSLDFHNHPGDVPSRYDIPPEDVNPNEQYPNLDGYGWTENDSLDVSIWANYGWTIYVKGTAGPHFIYTPTGGQEPWDKDVGDIVWMDGDPSGWHHLTTSTEEFHEWQTPPTGYNRLGDDALDFDCRVLLRWSNDSPGYYTYGDSGAGTGIMFTAIAD